MGKDNILVSYDIQFAIKVNEVVKEAESVLDESEMRAFLESCNRLFTEKINKE